MSEKINVEQAFDPEARQAQNEFDSYLESRPYKDERGAAHSPENGQFINSDEYFKTKRDQYEADTMPTAYEDMTMPDLARALALAEHEDDKTKVEDIQDVLVEKMAEFTENNNLDNDAQENLWNRIMKVKDGESQKLGSKSTEVEKQQKLDSLRDEILKIKQEMVDRASKGLDSPDYDVEFEDTQDDKIRKLLAEGYGTDDLDDPRVVADMKELDAYEDRLTHGSDSKVKESDPELEAGRILRRISEGRFNGEFDDTDEEQAFLEFLDILKGQFGTDSLEDERVQSALSRATDKINEDIKWLNDNASFTGTPLHEDLANIPDMEIDKGDVDHSAELGRINEQFKEQPNLGLRLKREYINRLVKEGTPATEALNLMVESSEEDIVRIAKIKLAEIGIDDPTEEQISIYRTKFIESMRAELQELEQNNLELEETIAVPVTSRGWQQKISDLSRKIAVSAQNTGYKVAEYFKHPEKGQKRTRVAAGLGVLAVAGGVLITYKYGISGNEVSRNDSGMSAAEKLIRKNPKTFNKMIEWYKAQKRANPGASTEKLARGFNAFLANVKK